MELIYIGPDFYRESETIMSPIYTVDGARSDWGFVQIALQNGESVHIRQATEKEMVYYSNRLNELIKSKEFKRKENHLQNRKNIL